MQLILTPIDTSHIMKKTIILILLVSGIGAFASEPLFLRKDNDHNFLGLPPRLFSKKRSQANSEGASNIAIKMNLTQLTLKNLSFQAEYGFHKKMSVSLGVSYLIQRPVPSSWYTEDPNYSKPTFGGFAITPEFRFYPRGKGDRPAPHGFYVGAYLRYAKYNLKQDYNDGSFRGNTKLTYGGGTVGVLIGRQWIIGKHFSIDWWIVGGGYGVATGKYKVSSPDVNMSQAEQDKLKADTQKYWDGWSYYGVNQFDITTTSNSVTFVVRGLPMYSIRFMGLCVGYAF